MTSRSRPFALAGLALLGGACGGAAPPPQRATPAAEVRAELEAVAARLHASPVELLSRRVVPELRARLAEAAPGSPERDDLEERLADRLVLEGEVDEALALYAGLLARTPEGAGRYAQLLRSLGLAHLRAAETRNCVGLHNPECCIFPLEGGGLHRDDAPARAALASLRAFLRLRPGNLKARWLINVAAMALGEYPSGLAEDERVPLAAFASEADVGRFADVAPRLGLDALDLAGGVVVEDLDGDGTLDLLTSTFHPLEGLKLFLNGADGFRDASAEAEVDAQLGGLHLVSADYDDDGDFDVLVLRGAWLTRQGAIRNSLLENDGGRFADVTRSAGLAEPAHPTQTAAFGDLDGDGDLDLMVGNESRVEGHPDEDHPTQLFRNEGDRTFVDVAAAAGVENDRYCKGVALGDHDDDGDLDAYLSNFGENRLYRNDGGLRFTDVAPELGVVEPSGRSFATWFFDVDSDGDLDLFAASYAGSVAELTAEALGLPRTWPLPCLYRNTGGAFEDATESLGLARFFLPMGAGFGDVDEDGWLDVYLGTGDPALDSILPNVMLRNDRGRGFQDVTLSSGTGHLQKGHGVAFADLDRDGDQDVYHQLGGFYPVDRFHNALFRNPGHGRRFLHVDLRGVESNRHGLGARLRVVVEGPDGRREIHRAVGSVSSFGAAPTRQEIGLGDSTRIVELEVRWPVSGTVSTHRDVPLDRRVVVTEGEPSLEVHELAPLAW